MSGRCQKCGVDLHPGLCGACAKEEAAAEIKRLHEALADVVRGCRWSCNRTVYCGTCARALKALPPGYEL